MSVKYTYNIKVRYKGDNYYHHYVKVCKVFERTKMYKQLMSLFNQDIVESFKYGVGDDVDLKPTKVEHVQPTQVLSYEDMAHLAFYNKNL
ncbi:MAG TPA: hypothetical protein DCM10_00555 [Xanthomarina gelatinilytica]|nr:hypothetical protein [Xanthomarina gelatinilytica]|tara:strand:- start:565 stop:834 length:270 start_codon:yes stop_codon:yes gene_type:complete